MSGTGSATTGVTIASLDAYEVSGSFAEADAASLAVGQTAAVEFPALPDVSAQGTVAWISPLGSTSGSVVTYTATVALTDVPDGVRLSQTATITVVTAEAANVLTLPSNAVTVTSETEGTVELVQNADDDATSSPETVTTTVGIGLQGDSTVEITSGLAEGDTVLVSVDTSTGTSSSALVELRVGMLSGGGAGGFPAGGGGMAPGGFGLGVAP
jgi:macrolide-specific efflux system membrane fusion protein